MSRTDKARAEVEAALDQDERLQAFETALLKGGVAKRVAKDLAVSVAASAALSAIGLRAMQTSAPPQVWVAVTDRRIILFQDTRQRRQPVGHLVIDVPREEVAVTGKSGVWSEVAVVDAGSGDPVFRLNFGVRKKDAATVLNAAG